MANHIYINTDLKDLTANAVANINRPTQVVRLPQIIEGEVVDVVLHLVKSDGQYDARSGSVEVVEVAVSAKGKAATSGTFRLNAGLEITGALTWNASAEAVAGALNALNGGTGAYGSQVSVAKLANGVYRVIFNDAGVRVDMAGQSLDLAPESTIGISTSVVGSGSIRAQQVIEISQQPAIYSETWASVGSTWTGQLDANTSRVQEMIAGAAEAFFEIKVGSDVVCQIPISILPSVAAPNSFPAHTLPDNLDAFAANPTTNGFFSPANWRDDLSLVVGEDVQAWSTNLDEVAARMSWNNQEKTFDIVTGSSNVTIQVGQEVLMYARNTSGLQMTDGQVVKVVGSQGNNPTIALAQADTVENASGVIGVVTQVINNNSNGFVSLIGKVRDLTLDSGTYTEGDLLYLSSTVAGGLTLVRPDIGVEIGRVIATSNGNNNAGIIEVNIDNDSSVHELEQQLLILINDNTTAIGVNTTAIAANTAAIGDNTAAIGDNTAAIGDNTAAIGDNTTAIGDNTTAIGDNATAIGDNTTAIGVNATAIGDNTNAIGVNSAAIAALPFVGSFMAPDYSYSTNSNALAAGFVENQLFLNTTSHNLSGVYPDNYTLLAQYSGASAAYSLRRLSSNTTSALRIRRTGDNEEVDVLFDSNDQVSLQSSVSPTTFGATLDEFVNTEIVTYTSDFSTGSWDGWLNFSGGAITSNIDGIGGLDDNLRYTQGIGQGILYNNVLFSLGSEYTISVDYYFPSSNTNTPTAIDFRFGSSVIETVATPVEDTWNSWSASGALSTSVQMQIRPANLATGDIFYIRNVVITQTTAGGHVTTWYDQSGNGNDATQTTAANQPKVVDAGVLVVDRDGKVALNGKGATLGLPNDAPMLSADGTYSLFAVVDFDDQRNGNDDFNTILRFDSKTFGGASSLRKPLIYLNQNTGGLSSTGPSYNLGSVSYTVAETLSVQLFTTIANPALLTGNHTLYADGALVSSSDTATSVNTETLLGFGRIFDNQETTVTNFLSEVIYYPSDQSANRVAIEANINNHYSPIAEDLYFRA